MLARSGQMDLATTVALPVIRGPVALAKSMSTLDLLSGGRLIVGVGPGSSLQDYAAVGIPFEDRWKRLDEAVMAMKALWCGNGVPFVGEFYSTEGIALEPYPAQRPGPRFGSEAGDRKPASGGRPAWATAGWPQPTTPPLKGSPAPGHASGNTWTVRASTRKVFPTHLRRCSSTLPKTAPRRGSSFTRCWALRSTVPKKS